MLATIISLTKELVKLPTISEDVGENKKGLQFILDYLQLPKKYITYYKDHVHPSIVITTQPHTKHFDVILHGHLDVVPEEKESFTPFEEDDKLYGRGTLDMKSGLATMIVIVKELIEKKTDKNIGLFITTDEEIGGYHGVKYLLDTIGYSSNFFITGEGMQKHAIITKAKGMLRIILEANGTSAHAGRPWLGDNAVEKLFAAYMEVKKLFPMSNDQTHWYSTLNLQRIEGGGNFTKVPHYAQAELDVRFTEEWQNSDEIIEAINKSIQPYEGIKVKLTQVNEAMLLTQENGTYITKLSQSFKKFSPHNHTIFGFAHATSDARFASWKGIPAVEFGPVGKNSHHHQEYVEIKSLHTYYEILKDFLLSFSK